MKIGATLAFLATSMVMAGPAFADDWAGYNSGTAYNSELAACQNGTFNASRDANNARDAAQRQFPNTPIFVHLAACKCEVQGGTYTCMVRWELTNWRRGGDD